MNARILLPAALAAVLSLPAFSANAVASHNMLGEKAPAAKAQRTVVITPGMRSVRVQSGQIVKFMAGGKSFTWDFDGPQKTVKLNQIAPPNMLNHTVTAYISPNPLYQGGAS